MKQYFLSSRRFMALAICLITLCSLLCIPAFADEETKATGWIEVKTEYPEGLNQFIVMTITNKETEEEMDLLVLPENDYVMRKQIPVGKYSILESFVAEDFRFETVADVSEFEVKESVAAPINLTVTIRPEYLEEENEEPAEEVPETEPSEETEEVTEPSENPEEVPETEESTPSEELSEEIVEQPSEIAPEEVPKEEKDTHPLVKALISISATGIFVALVFGFVYLIRRFMNLSE